MIEIANILHSCKLRRFSRKYKLLTYDMLTISEQEIMKDYIDDSDYENYFFRVNGFLWYLDNLLQCSTKKLYSHCNYVDEKIYNFLKKQSENFGLIDTDGSVTYITYDLVDKTFKVFYINILT